jgi:hypothetical protein
MDFKHELCTRRTASLCFLAAWGWVIGCARYQTLADEMEGKFDLSPSLKKTYRTYRWYPSTHNRYPPYYDLMPAEMEHIAGIHGPGGVRLLHHSRKKTFNYVEGSILFGRLLESANIEEIRYDRFGQAVYPLQSRLLFPNHWLIMASVNPAVLLMIPLGMNVKTWEGEPLYEFLSLPSFNVATSQKDQSLIHPFKDFGPSLQGSSAMLSSLFPHTPGIQVLSDQWSGTKTIEDLNQDEAFPFEFVKVKSMPGFLRLILKDSVKTVP